MTACATSRGASAALVVLASGCVFPLSGLRETGRTLSRADADAVEKPGTTKAELLDRLGPPMAIVGAREYVRVPAANVHHEDEMNHGGSRFFGGGSWVQQGDAWLELFARRRPLREDHRVWYWYSTSESGVGVFFLVSYSQRTTRTAQLWVLVDEATGLVEDEVFLER